MEDLSFIPIATFSVLRGLPLVALSRNSLYPAVIVGRDSLIVRVIRRHRLHFDDIGEIRLSRPLTYQLTITPRRGFRAFSANFLRREEAVRVVEALKSRGLKSDVQYLA